MTWDEFVAGKYGLSHGLVTLVVIATGTGLGWLVGVLALGNMIASLIALTFYFSREVAQGHSWNPGDWSEDGKLDLLVPTFVIAINTMAVLIWST